MLTLEQPPAARAQVFLNLPGNAAEAPGGRPDTIRVRAAPEGSPVLVEVADDGPGLAADLPVACRAAAGEREARPRAGGADAA